MLLVVLTQRRIIAGFGLTECAPITHSATLDGQAKPGSIGRLLPATAGRLVDPIRGTISDVTVGTTASC